MHFSFCSHFFKLETRLTIKREDESELEKCLAIIYTRPFSIAVQRLTRTNIQGIQRKLKEGLALIYRLPLFIFNIFFFQFSAAEIVADENIGAEEIVDNTKQGNRAPVAPEIQLHHKRIETEHNYCQKEDVIASLFSS